MTSNDGQLKATRDGAAAIVAIDRPAARNALTRAMIASLSAELKRWARDPQIYALAVTSAVDGVFCAGGDVRELVATARTDPGEAQAGLGHEYALNWQLDCFTKPTVSLIDGAVMGSGVGLTLYGTHRVAGGRYKFAMPETAIGFFPDVGTAHVLARLPDEIGIYLGLTGRALDRSDAYGLGLCTHCVDAAAFPAIARALSDADPVDPLLDGLHRDPGPVTLTPERRAIIAAAFSASRVAEILRRLEQRAEASDAFAAEIASDLRTKSPIALAVTLRALRRARGLDLRETLIQDYRVAVRFLETPDFYEGVRAQLIDKDRKPGWEPRTLAGVTDAEVDRFFEIPPGGDLALPLRAEMQSSRI
jgi:enoyl-CoA hydratase